MRTSAIAYQPQRVLRLNFQKMLRGNQNQKILCESRLSKRRICYIAGMAKGIKMKFLRNVEEDVELNQNTLCASRLSTGVYVQYLRTC